jgi:hypothetical protein
MSDWSEFVEGYLTGVVLRDKDKAVDIYLSDCSHRKHTLTAFGVKEMRVWEMRQKNIIDRISLWNSSSCESEYQERISFLLYGEQSDKNRVSPLRKVAVENAIQSIRDGSMILMEIEPVYGALVLIQAERVTIYPQQL